MSEWFLLESLMQQFRVPGLGYRLVLALAGAAVALTVGFAGVTFVRLVGLIVLGPRHRVRAAAGAGTAGPAGPRCWCCRAACLAIAAVTPLEIRVIAAGLSPAVPASLTMGALKSPWVLQPVFDGFSILSPSWLWVEMPLMLLLTVLFAWAVSGRRLLRVRRVPAWRSATIGVEGAGLLHRVRLRQPHPPGAGRRPAHPGRAARGHDGAKTAATTAQARPTAPIPRWAEAAAHLRYASDVMEVVETYLYRPALGFFMAVVTAAKRLQSGRLDAYLLYMLIALIAVIAVATALA